MNGLQRTSYEVVIISIKSRTEQTYSVNFRKASSNEGGASLL